MIFALIISVKRLVKQKASDEIKNESINSSFKSIKWNYRALEFSKCFISARGFSVKFLRFREPSKFNQDFDFLFSWASRKFFFIHYLKKGILSLKKLKPLKTKPHLSSSLHHIHLVGRLWSNYLCRQIGPLFVGPVFSAVHNILRRNHSKTLLFILPVDYLKKCREEPILIYVSTWILPLPTNCVYLHLFIILLSFSFL